MKSLVQFFEEIVDRFKENPYMWEKKDGEFHPTTYGELRELVHQFAAGLMALGVKKRDREQIIEL
jgi:long-chain acyl-CoA synthetase